MRLPLSLCPSSLVSLSSCYGNSPCSRSRTCRRDVPRRQRVLHRRPGQPRRRGPDLCRTVGLVDRHRQARRAADQHRAPPQLLRAARRRRHLHPVRPLGPGRAACRRALNPRPLQVLVPKGEAGSGRVQRPCAARAFRCVSASLLPLPARVERQPDARRRLYITASVEKESSSEDMDEL